LASAGLAREAATQLAKKSARLALGRSSDEFPVDYAGEMPPKARARRQPSAALFFRREFTILKLPICLASIETEFCGDLIHAPQKVVG
jgi:hypothetical protein